MTEAAATPQAMTEAELDEIERLVKTGEWWCRSGQLRKPTLFKLIAAARAHLSGALPCIAGGWRGKLDQAWGAINALGGTNPLNTDDIHFYNRGIEDALKEIEKLGGRDPLLPPTPSGEEQKEDEGDDAKLEAPGRSDGMGPSSGGGASVSLGGIPPVVPGEGECPACAEYQDYDHADTCPRHDPTLAHLIAPSPQGNAGEPDFAYMNEAARAIEAEEIARHELRENNAKAREEAKRQGVTLHPKIATQGNAIEGLVAKLRDTNFPWHGSKSLRDEAATALETMGREVERLKSLIDTHFDEQRKAQAALTAAQAEVELLDSKVKVANADISSLNACIAHLEAERAAAQERITRLEDDLIEERAKLIYEKMPFDGPTGSKPDWVERGNSLKQDEARRLARAATREA